MTQRGGRKPRIIDGVKEYTFNFRRGTTINLNGMVIAPQADGGFKLVVREPLGNSLANPATACDNPGDTNSAGPPRE